MSERSTHAVTELCANMMRITAGAGRPESLVHQAREVVESFSASAEVDSNRVYPYQPAANAMRQIMESDTTKSSEQRAINSIVQASLRLAASRMLSQPTQERSARRELREALAEYRLS